MSTIPDNHVAAEGRNLRAAIEAAAERLGVPYAQVEHKIDMAHFRSAQGAGIGADTVRIFAWAKDPADLAPVLAAEDWMKGLLVAMDRTGQVRAERRGNGVVVHVDVGEAGRHLVGRQGITLRAVQYLLEQSIGGRFEGTSFRIDVARSGEDEDRPREDRPRRDDDRGRDDRGRDDRGRDDRRETRGDDRPRRDDRDRGDRGDRRPRDRDDRRPREDRPRRSEAEIQDLQRLARKIAERVASTGEPEMIRRELNSFERRMVHTEIATMEGVRSRSVGEGHDRRIEIYAPSGDEEPEQEA